MWREWQVSLQRVSRWLQLGGPEQLPGEKSRKGEFKEVRELDLERSFNNSGTEHFQRLNVRNWGHKFKGREDRRVRICWWREDPNLIRREEFCKKKE